MMSFSPQISVIHDFITFPKNPILPQKAGSSQFPLSFENLIPAISNLVTCDWIKSKLWEQVPAQSRYFNLSCSVRKSANNVHDKFGGLRVECC